jgi:N-acetylmuramoyl-L-alanine amidase
VKALLLGILLALTLAGPAPAARGTPILGSGSTTAAPAQEWARAHGATKRFESLAPLYWQLAPSSGVRPEVAYAQAGKETAFGRFGGVLDSSFHNPCGLKRKAGGGNFDPGAHKRFPSWRVGVMAHLDHLGLYAGAPGYPREQTPDPRHFAFLRGEARSVEALGAAWAPAKDYGRSLARLVSSLERTADRQRDSAGSILRDDLIREHVSLAQRGH